MSAPLLLGCTAAVVCVSLASLGAANALMVRERLEQVADAAALAAADAEGGWIDASPCGIAARVAEAGRAALESCRIDDRFAAAVTVRSRAPFSWVRARARAGPDHRAERLLHQAEERWVWPSASRGVTQGHHDGFAIDLEVGRSGLLLAPAQGVVIAAGADGGGVPAACLARPEWWRGPNHTVIMRHEVRGLPVFSSHNHIEAGSAEVFGIRPGVTVRAGQPVARAGMSGCTSAPHTHFTVSSSPRNHAPDIDPYTLLGQP